MINNLGYLEKQAMIKLKQFKPLSEIKIPLWARLFKRPVNNIDIQEALQESGKGSGSLIKKLHELQDAINIYK